MSPSSKVTTQQARLADVLAKARRVKAPGAKGGKFYRTKEGAGEVRYGSQPEHRPHPGPSRSEHQKAYDAKVQAREEQEKAGQPGHRVGGGFGSHEGSGGERTRASMERERAGGGGAERDPDAARTTPQERARQERQAVDNRDGDGDDTAGQCPTCGGPSEELRALGSRTHYRCRNCGMDHSTKPRYGEPGYVNRPYTDEQKREDAHAPERAQKPDAIRRRDRLKKELAKGDNAANGGKRPFSEYLVKGDGSIVAKAREVKKGGKTR